MHLNSIPGGLWHLDRWRMLGPKTLSKNVVDRKLMRVTRVSKLKRGRDESAPSSPSPVDNTHCWLRIDEERRSYLEFIHNTIVLATRCCEPYPNANEQRGTADLLWQEYKFIKHPDVIQPFIPLLPTYSPFPKQSPQPPPSSHSTSTTDPSPACERRRTYQHAPDMLCILPGIWKQ